MPRLPTVLALALPLCGCPDYGVQRIGEEPSDAGDRLLQVEPEVLDFGTVEAGGSYVERFEIRSVGTAPVSLEPLSVHGAGTFTLLSGDQGGTLAPGEVREVEVVYQPASAADEAEVVVESDAAVPRILVDLLGEGVMPDLVFDPPSLLLQSWDGQAVQGSFLARNEGLVDLVVESWALQGERFEVETALPATLAPGEETEILVTWTPEGEGQEFGYFWASSNDPAGDEVATLEGLYTLPCLGLHEAVTRGWARITGDPHGIEVAHQGEDTDICIDRWYLYISKDTQDAGAGDPAYLPEDVYGEEGSIELARGESVTFLYGAAAEPAWWCVEETQITDQATSYDFTGAQVPALLLDLMLGGGADPNGAVWAALRENPVLMVGRERGWAALTAGGTTRVTVEVSNLGRVQGAGRVWETIPAGMSASDFDPMPEEELLEDDGTVRYAWDVELEAAIDTEIEEPTIYDIRELSYTLEVSEEACLPRTRTPEPEVTWVDAAGQAQVAWGSPLMIECW